MEDKELKFFVDLPWYFIVGDRPVKIEKTSKGLGSYAYNWDTGEFDLNMKYFSKVISGYGDIDEVDEREFNIKVEELRNKLKEFK